MQEGKYAKIWISKINSDDFNSHIKEATSDEDVQLLCKKNNSIESSIQIGKASFEKAKYLGTANYIPEPLWKIDRLVSPFKIIDAELIQDIIKTFDYENKTPYQLNDKKNVVKFLEEHMGETIYIHHGSHNSVCYDIQLYRSRMYQKIV